jgi:uncharacterized membrane protein YoaK (UPF0700 family)
LTKSSIRKRWSGTASPAAELPARLLPFLLSVIAGATDVIGFLGLGGLFTAHITGNLVVLAAHIVAGDPAVFSYILSVPVFMLVLFLTRLVADGFERAGIPSLSPLLVLQLLALAAFFALSVTAGPWRNADALLAIVAGMCGVAAMAVQNALVQISLVGAPSTAVMTTNVTRFMMDLGAMAFERDPRETAAARARAKRTWPAIVGFATGCALGAAFEARFGLSSLALPAGLALVAVGLGFFPTLDEGRRR